MVFCDAARGQAAATRKPVSHNYFALQQIDEPRFAPITCDPRLARNAGQPDRQVGKGRLRTAPAIYVVGRSHVSISGIVALGSAHPRSQIAVGSEQWLPERAHPRVKDIRTAPGGSRLEWPGSNRIGTFNRR